MGVKTFAAIDVGSYELSMKVFEFSTDGGMKEIDHIRHRLDLGSQTYVTGKLNNDKVTELCYVLNDFAGIMKAYQVEDYKAYGTSAIRETENTSILLDQIRNQTGLIIDVLSNSEQRFLDYKSVASKGEKFNSFIKKRTAIVDIGGGSLQISLFDEETLITTQNIKLGILRIKEMLNKLQPKRANLEEVIGEMAANQLDTFQKMYLLNNKIDNIIVVDDYVSLILNNSVSGMSKPGQMATGKYASFMDTIRNKADSELADSLGIPEENIGLLNISAALVMNMIQIMGAELLWAPGVTLCDGIAYEYAEKKNKIIFEHDFDRDILDCAKNMSKRYMGSRKRSEVMEKNALAIYDAMKRVHGLGKRERLLLQLAAILQDTGKFISLSNAGASSYNIVMSTEIIGLSHAEREIVAYTVQYVYDEFKYYSDNGVYRKLPKDAYLTIAKLTAILRITNALDISNKQKCNKISANLHGNELFLSVQEETDLMLEKALFTADADFFEEMFCIRPVIKA